MIVYKRWNKETYGRVREVCDGWFLFGLIPLYLRKVKQ